MNLAGKSCKIWPRPPSRRHVLQEKLHAVGTGCGACGERMRRAAGAAGGRAGKGRGRDDGAVRDWNDGPRGGGGRMGGGRRRVKAGAGMTVPSGIGMTGRGAAVGGRARGRRRAAGQRRAGGQRPGRGLQGPGRDVQKMAQRDYRAPRKSAILSAARGPCPRARAGPPPPRGGPARSCATGRERAGAPAAAGRPHPAEACHAGATAQTMVPPPAAPRAQ